MERFHSRGQHLCKCIGTNECLHKKRVQFLQDCFGTPTWPPWRHLKTVLYKHRYALNTSNNMTWFGRWKFLATGPIAFWQFLLTFRPKILPSVLSVMSTYNPGQNYLRKFSPSCPLSYATKLFPKRRLCGKKTPSPNSMLLPTNAQGSGFLLNTQQHCFQGKGEREEPVQLRCLEKCCPSIQFSRQFCPRLWI